jgi:hypothetical protein
MQLFGLVNTMLSHDRATAERDLSIARYAVIPLSPNSGARTHCLSWPIVEQTSSLQRDSGTPLDLWTFRHSGLQSSCSVAMLDVLTQRAPQPPCLSIPARIGSQYQDTAPNHALLPFFYGQTSNIHSLAGDYPCKHALPVCGLRTPPRSDCPWPCRMQG